jgi:hypothetical protein
VIRTIIGSTERAKAGQIGLRMDFGGRRGTSLLCLAMRPLVAPTASVNG